jgi:hypothetical protein
MSLTPTFQGEVQMRRWSDSSTQGVQVTFALPDAEDLEPLKGKEGKRFMAVLVQIGDDEQPVQQPRKDARGPLCREACDLCAMPEFALWVNKSTGCYVGTPELAKAWICSTCAVESRKDLDTVATAREKFIAQIRAPFMRHMQAKKAA